MASNLGMLAGSKAPHYDLRVIFQWMWRYKSLSKESRDVQYRMEAEKTIERLYAQAVLKEKIDDLLSLKKIPKGADDLTRVELTTSRLEVLAQLDPQTINDLAAYAFFDEYGSFPITYFFNFETDNDGHVSRIYVKPQPKFFAASSPLAHVNKRDKLGGIDLDPNLFEIETRGDGKLTFPKLKIPVQGFDIQGLIPVILNIVPIPSLPILLGLIDAEEEPYDFSYDTDLDPADRKVRFLNKESAHIS